MTIQASRTTHQGSGGHRGRFLPSWIDDEAGREPKRVCIQIAASRTTEAVQVTVGELANAINRAAWWLDDTLGKPGKGFPTVAYLGPSDLRYLIFVVAAVKAGYKLLLSSPRNSIEGHVSLLENLECAQFLAPAEQLRLLLPQLVEKCPALRGIEAPQLNELLDVGAVPPYVWPVSSNEARDLPFVVLHTSGSTGLPKPVLLNHGWVSAIDAWNRLPAIGLPQTVFQPHPRHRFMGLFPSFHAAGLGMGINALFHRDLLIMAPPVPLDKELAIDMIKRNAPDIVHMPPSLVAEMALYHEDLRALSKVHSVIYGGGPVPTSAGQSVAKFTHIQNIYGSSEAGPLPLEWVAAEDLPYIKFSPLVGAEFRPYGKDLCQMVFVRDPDLSEYQGIFNTFPDLQEYHTKDVFSRHPDPEKPDLWLLQGRTDDIIVYSTGEKVNPTAFENALNSHPLIRSALLNGHGRFHSALLLEPWTPVRQDDVGNFIDAVWPTVQSQNKSLPAFARLSRDMLLLTVEDRPLPRADKGTVQKSLALSLYQRELEILYARLSRASGLHLHGTRTSISYGSHETRVVNGNSPPTTNGVDVQTVENQLLNFVKDSLGLETLSGHDNIFDIGFDSLGALNLARRASQLAQGFPVQPSDIYRRPTIAELATYVNGHDEVPKESTYETMSQLLEKFVAQAPMCLRPPLEFNRDKMVILLTGSTGSLGTYLLDALYKRQDVEQIICLNRKSDAESRQTESLRNRGLHASLLMGSPTPESLTATSQGLHGFQLSPRVRFLQVDLSSPRLGLEAGEYRRLLASVTHIFHNAWPVNFNLPFDAFIGQVHGVQHLVELCTRSRHDARIFFISSVGAVIGESFARAGSIPEEVPMEWSAALNNGYAQSKLLSERMLVAAADAANVRSTICRIGQIAGPTTSFGGSWPVQEWFPSLIFSSRHIGFLPSSLGRHDRIDWIPVDVLAKSLVDLLDVPSKELFEAAARGSDLGGITASPLEVLHFVNPRASTWSELLSPLQERLRLSTVPLHRWIELVSEGGETAQNPAIKLLDFFSSLNPSKESGSSVCEFDTSRSQQRSPTMAQTEPITMELMNVWLDQWGLCTTASIA